MQLSKAALTVDVLNTSVPSSRTCASRTRQSAMSLWRVSLFADRSFFPDASSLTKFGVALEQPISRAPQRMEPAFGGAWCGCRQSDDRSRRTRQYLRRPTGRPGAFGI